MRGLLIFLAVVLYLFSLILIQSELLKLEGRKETLANRLIELRGERKLLDAQIMDLANLARIEAKAKRMGLVYPQDRDILGTVK